MYNTKLPADTDVPLNLLITLFYLFFFLLMQSFGAFMKYHMLNVCVFCAGGTAAKPEC